MRRLALFGLGLTVACAAAAQRAPDPDTLVVAGYAESSRVAVGEPFTVWISFENHTGQPIRDLRFTEPFRTPGFTQVEPCWSNGAPACQAGQTQSPARTGLPRNLAAGAAVTVRGDLVRRGRAGNYLLAGAYGWRDAAGHDRRGIVWVGPVEVTKNWADWRARVTEDLPEVLTEVVLPVLKDLAWPLVFFLLGWMFKAGEQRRAAVQQTWTQMLSKSHQNAERHYMPVSSAIYGWRDSLEPASEEQVDKALYYFALLLRRMDELRRDISGFYFKDRLGEMVAGRAWELLRDRFQGRFPAGEGIEKAELLARSVSAQETFHEFKERLGEEPVYAHPQAARRALWEVRQAFRDWIRGLEFQELELPLAELLETVIDFEMNRPYEPWYDRPEPFDRRTFADLERRLAAWVENRPAAGGPQRKERRLAGEILGLLQPYRRRNAGRRRKRLLQGN